MKRVIWPQGSEQNFELFTTTLQQYAEQNLLNRVQLLLKKPGLKLVETDGVLSGGFSLNASATEIVVGAGKAITASGEYINYSGVTDTAMAQNAEDGIHVISLYYRAVKNQPVKALNAFVYDKTGSDSLSKASRQEDGFYLSWEATTGQALSSIVPTANKIPLMLVRCATNQWQLNPLQGYAGDTAGYTATGYFVDLRKNSILHLEANLLDEKEVFLKSRNNIGARAVSGQVEFTNEVHLDGLTFLNNFSLDSATDLVLKQNATEIMRVNSSNELVVKKGKAEDLKILVDQKWLPVEWKDVIPSNPRNLRIWDIYPTSNPDENVGFIEVRWNWTALAKTGASPGQINISATDLNSYPVDFSTDDIAAMIDPGEDQEVGKEIYFPLSGNKYPILGVTDEGGTWVFSVQGDASGESTPDASTGARIIDRGTEEYNLRFQAADQGGREVKESYSLDLDRDYILNPAWVQKLPLGKSWVCSIRGKNRNQYSERYQMPSGSYDPDAYGSGQAVVTYAFPFLMKLPNIANAQNNGNFTVEANTSGFTIKIDNVWSSNSDLDRRAHEYEIAYSSRYTISEAEMNANNPDIQKVYSRTREIHIASGTPTAYSVGVRPLQNKQPVAPAVIPEENFYSGGGGVLPTRQNLFTGGFQVTPLLLDCIGVEYLTKDSSIASYLFTAEQKSMTLRGEPIYQPGFFEEKTVNKPASTTDITAAFLAGFTTDPSPSLAGLVITPQNVPAASGNYNNQYGIPLPRYFKFEANNYTPAATIPTKNNWAKITGPAVSLAPGETISLNAYASCPNYGRGAIQMRVVDADTPTIVLQNGQTISGSIYGSNGIQNINGRNISVAYTNGTGVTQNVRVQIIGWGCLNTTDTGTPIIGMVYISPNGSGFFPQIPLGADPNAQPVSANFGTEVKALFCKKFTTAQSNLLIKGAHTTFDRAYDGGRYIHTLSFDTGVTFSEDDFATFGETESSRFIAEVILPVNFDITQIIVHTKTISGATAQNPAVLRFYPKNYPGQAFIIEIEEPGLLQKKAGGGGQKVSLLGIAGEAKTLIIDAYDPSTPNSNNTAAFSGSIEIWGNPMIQSSFTLNG